jgi:hypothetical protein
MLKEDQDSVIGGDKFLLQVLIGETFDNTIICDTNPLKRTGALKAIRNCLFEKGEHMRIIAKTQLIDFVLLRLSKGTKAEDKVEFVEDKLPLRRLLSEIVLIITTSNEGADAFNNEERFQKMEFVIEHDTDPEHQVGRNLESAIEKVKRRIAEKSGLQFGEGEFVRLQTVNDDGEDIENPALTDAPTKPGINRSGPVIRPFTGDVQKEEYKPTVLEDEDEEMEFNSLVTGAEEQSNKVTIAKHHVNEKD